MGTGLETREEGAIGLVLVLERFPDVAYRVLSELDQKSVENYRNGLHTSVPLFCGQITVNLLT